MPTTSSSIQFICAPGVKRDGTQAEGQNWIDSQHTRFYRNLPKSMGGYRTITQGFGEIVRGATYMYTQDLYNTVYGGSASQLYNTIFDQNGFGSGVTTRTPSSGLVNSPDNIWQFSGMQYNPGGFNAIVAHAAPNMDIASSVETNVFYGDITATSNLIPISDSTVTNSISLAQAVLKAQSILINGTDSNGTVVPTGISLSQAVAGAGNAVINGIYATAGVATFPEARQVTMTSSNAVDTTQTAIFTGLDKVGNPLTETLAFNGTHIISSFNLFSSVKQIAISGALVGNFIAGVNGISRTSQARNIVIASSNAGDTTQVITISGTDSNNDPLTDIITANGTTPVITPDQFLTINSITVSASMLGNITVGTEGITVVCSGGILGLYPFLFLFGNNGQVKWSTPGDLTNFTGIGSGSTIISTQKVIAAVPDRSAGAYQPAAIFFTLDKLVRANFSSVASGEVFDFSEVPGFAGLLSSSAIAEYDGIYYWPANGRFQSYNGVIRELPNNMNLLWFYQNYNRAYRQKIFSMTMPQWGEIWWFFPFGNATECDHALILNVREGSYYSTALSRSAGLTNNIFTYPVLFDNQLNTNNTYSLWQHEYGTDEVVGTLSLAIEKYIQSAEISLCAPNSVGLPSNQDTAVQIDRLELDLIQTGDMTITYLGRDYPRATPRTATLPFTPNQGTINKSFEARQVNITMNSNVEGGSFQFGRNTIYIQTTQGDDNYVGSGG